MVGKVRKFNGFGTFVAISIVCFGLDFELLFHFSGFSTENVMRVLVLGLEHPHNDVREAALSCIVDVYKIVSLLAWSF